MSEDHDVRWVDSMPDAYDRWLGPVLFQPFAADLAARIGSRHPQAVLELAAGTGRLTRAILQALPDVALVATDMNPAMVDQGRAAVPGATWRPADAGELPFDDGTFDLVACQFGVMFLPDRPAAFAGVRRVLEPGGTFVANTWAPVEDHGFGLAFDAALTDLFPDDPPTFLRTIPHGYADPEAVTADLRAGGLEPLTVERVTLPGTSTAADVARGFCLGTPVRGEIERRAPLDPTLASVIEHLEAALGPGPVVAEMSAWIIEATAPT
jgi:SAM-dependent methyltransferase